MRAKESHRASLVVFFVVMVTWYAFSFICISAYPADFIITDGIANIAWEKPKDISGVFGYKVFYKIKDSSKMIYLRKIKGLDNTKYDWHYNEFESMVELLIIVASCNSEWFIIDKASIDCELHPNPPLNLSVE